MSTKRSSSLQSKSGTRPKKARTAYNFFFSEERLRIQAHVFEETGARPSYAQVSRLVAAQWKDLDQSKKQRFLVLAAKDKRDYAMEMIKNYTGRREAKRKSHTPLSCKNPPGKGIAHEAEQVAQSQNFTTFEYTSEIKPLRLPSTFSITPFTGVKSPTKKTESSATLIQEHPTETQWPFFSSDQPSQYDGLSRLRFGTDEGVLEPLHLSALDQEISFDSDTVEFLETTFDINHHFY
eukprot:scaffold1695_cov167-Amphora_coffeaeformis.AAC.17